ncbi:MAG TPA: histidinol dehydrogenase [Acidimicrobiales bacterium]|nr:histidinol dehydrogenase [Actinomycetes bacterium]MDP6160828.1 histidinol dehydrogenase [Acidimicrobiales bacterium]HJM73399.1 histidinol dehydrogenase [Acidimicrobiales bacterium]
MLRRLDLRGDLPSSPAVLRAALPRPDLGGPGSEDAVLNAVRAILNDVQARGDEAVRELTSRFDDAEPPTIQVDPVEVAAALDRIDPVVRTALEVAAEAIRRHHVGQVRSEHRTEDAGLVVRSVSRPVERAGCYVPGGRAAYPSTVLMTAVPARAAGVDEVVVCVPPDPDGRVAEVTLAAAAVAGVDAVYAVGGAQAVAAMAFGTESIPPVDVIVGPGNVYVALAKREVAGLVGVPSAFAGPSEVVVVADATVPAGFVAIDIVVQAEHGPDGLAWLITWDEAVADAVDVEVSRIVEVSPRCDDVTATLTSAGWVVLVDGPDEALAVSDAIAPEHLQLMVDDAESLADRVRHAGAVFCGPWSPASLGDYVAGPSHVLPTAGTARFSGALRVADFTKEVHVVSADREALERLAPHVAALAGAEGLDAHAASVRTRVCHPLDRSHDA